MSVVRYIGLDGKLWFAVLGDDEPTQLVHWSRPQDPTTWRFEDAPHELCGLNADVVYVDDIVPDLQQLSPFPKLAWVNPNPPERRR